MLITQPWALYNEIDEYAAEWIENLIRLRLVAPGVVDRRSIVDIQPDELRGFRQCHFFAGIAVWSYALRRAGVADDAAVWTGSCPCFTAGTLILTDSGLLPIEQVTTQHKVWTHAGNWQRVVKVGSEWKAVGDLVGQGHFGLTCTDDHPFYAMDRKIQSTRRNSKSANIHKVSGPDWVAAKSMPGKWWAMPECYPPQSEPKVDGFSQNELAMLSGLYVGDGWLGTGRRSDRLILGVSESKCAEILDLLPGLKFYISKQRTTVRMELRSEALVTYLRESFSEKSTTKTLPSWLLSASRDFKESFLSGWDLTDGTRIETNGCRRITTASRPLAIAGRMLLVSMGFSVSLRKVETPMKTIIEGREVNQSDYYTLNRSNDSRYRIESDGRIWFKAKDFRASNVLQRVFNIEVENDNSYLADGIFVHNCQPFSAAGKGTGVADERHLWPAFFHLIQARRPPRIYGEQVASKDGLGWLDLVLTDMEASDYSVWAVDTPSAGSGSPHIRQRLRFCADDLRSAPSGMADRDNSGLEGWWEPGRERPIERALGASGLVGVMADADGRNTCSEWEQRSGQQRQQPQDRGTSVMANAVDGYVSQSLRGAEGRDGSAATHARTAPNRPGPTNGFWRDADWLFCRDGKWRPVESGSFPLVNGSTFHLGSGGAFEGKSRQGMLKAYGNAVDAEATTDFIEATLEADTIDLVGDDLDELL